MFRITIAALFVLHGLIHFLGFAKAFALADIPQLVQPILEPQGVLWLIAGVLCIVTAGALFVAPRWWWAFGIVAVVLSQAVIVTSWNDAFAGTVANVLLLAASLYAFASRGPLSLRFEFERDLHRMWRPAESAAGEPISEADLTSLPEPVRRYLRRAGVVGHPAVTDFRATWKGRMRSTADSPWMTFTADQLDIVDTPQRFFMMDARMKGLPVDVLHAFDDRGATMRVKLLSVRSMVDAKGPALTRAETVTLFNDLCCLAPGALLSPSITWKSIDEHTATAHFTLGVNTVAAELSFDDLGDLVDFVADGRGAVSADGRTVTPMRWSTPVRDYAQVGPARVATKAEVMWHPESGDWTYGEFELTSLAYNVARRSRAVGRPAGHPYEGSQKEAGNDIVQSDSRGLRSVIMGHPLTSFFVIAYAISWSLWGIAALGAGQVVFLLGGLGPLASALIVTRLSGASVVGWIRSLLVWRVNLGYYALALLFPVAIYAVINLVLAALGQTLDVTLLAVVAPGYLGTFFMVATVGGGFEEPGWRGFALPRLQERRSPLVATLLLGLAWGVWHIPLYGPAGFVVPLILAFFYTWLYNRTGSVLLCLLLHASFTPAQNFLTIAVDPAPTGSGAASIGDSTDLVVLAVYLVAALALILATRGRLGLRESPRRRAG
jgi:membrane protease YdiL (CAAX protease family)